MTRTPNECSLPPDAVGSLVDLIQEGVIVANCEGVITYCNGAAIRLFGWAADELVGQNYVERFPVRPRAGTAAEAPHRAEAEHWEREREVCRKDGTRVWIETQARQYTDDTGKPAGVIRTFRDISERKQTLIERRQFVDQHTTLFERAVVGIFRSSLEGRYLIANQTLAEIFGYESADDLLKTVTNVGTQIYRNPEDRARILNALAEQNKMLDFECECRRKDGTPIWVRQDSRAVREESGRLAYFEGFIQDITARKQAEKVALESEVRYRSLIAALAEGVVFHSATGEILACNASAERILGLTADQICGRSSLDPMLQAIRDDGSPFPGDEHPCMVTLRTGCRCSDVVMGVQKPDGSTTWITVNAEPLTHQGEQLPYGVVCSFIDITSRRVLDEAKRQSEERYRLAILATNDAIWDLDLETSVVSRNERYAIAFGRTPEGVNPFQWWLERVHPGDRERVTSAFRQATRGTERNWDCEYRFLREDGVWAEVKDRAYLARDDSGRCTRAVGSMLDVTERNRAEAVLRENESRLRRILEGMPIMLDAFDEHGNLVAWNQECERVTGYTAAEMVGNSRAIELLYPDRPYRERMHSEWSQRGNNYYHWEWDLTCKDGSVRTISWSNIAAVLPIPGWARWGVGFDVTERKQAEAALLERDRAIQAVSGGIIISDPNLPDNPIIYVSSGFERLTGYSAKEVVGRNCRFLQGEDSDPAAVQEIREAIQKGQPCTVELQNYRKDGTPFWNKLSISPVFGEDGRLTHFVGVQMDVTAQHRLEEQLRQSQKMEAIGRLAGGVAHDFNNLLTVINGYAELLLQDSDVQGRDSQREGLAAILDAGHRAAALTAQLLAFGRKTMIKPKLLDLNRVVETAGRMLRRLIVADVRIDFELNPDPTIVKIDPGQLNQLLMNLALNAGDAMPGGGVLTIATMNVEFPGELSPVPEGCQPGRYVQLTVSDTGDGMSEEVRRQIFEPFFTTKELGKGTGLGLATAYGIVSQAGGSIAVETGVGDGTTFRILLPAVEQLSQSNKTVAAPVAPLGTETILLAEDEEYVRRIARQVLEMHGYTVIDADSGEAAVQAATTSDGPIHLLVTDVVMPDFGGRTLADQVLAICPEIAVLYLSGYSNDAVFRRGIETSAEAFLQKPFTAHSLVCKVREVLDAVSEKLL
ncbi:MAG: domain S-box protein [Schlesneria sp.]|nr:domain S-box protein [Schlesneria sp.]